MDIPVLQYYYYTVVAKQGPDTPKPWINITAFSHIPRQTEASSLWFRNIVAVFAPYFLSFCGFSSGPSPRLWWAAVWWELGNLQPPGCDAPPLSGSRGRSPEVSTPPKKERNSLNKSFYEHLKCQIINLSNCSYKTYMRSGEQRGVGQAGRGAGRRLQGGLSRRGAGGWGGARESGRSVNRALAAFRVTAMGTRRSGRHLQGLQTWKWHS